MNRQELQTTVATALHRVAPDVQPEALQPQTRIREDLEIDSFDFLQWMIALNQSLGIEVPEADYPKLFTFGSALDYLAGRLAVA